MQKDKNKKNTTNAENKCKAAWKIVNDTLKDNYKHNEIKAIVDGETLLNNGDDIATCFNKFFIDIANNTCIQNNQAKINVSRLANSIYLEPVDAFETFKITMSLRNTNSAGYDEINTKLIKQNLRHFIEPLTHIINLSLEHGVFPEILKYSVVKPLFKKGLKSDTGNYRPITLVPIFSKIFERTMSQRVMKFLEKKYVLSEQQNGFIKKNRQR